MQFVPEFRCKKEIADAKNANQSQKVTWYGMIGNNVPNLVHLMESAELNSEQLKVVNQVTPFVPEFQLKKEIADAINVSIMKLSI